jgi:hypothetical protein
MKHNDHVNLPATFRLPKSGERDPYFGLSRSFYYAAEAEGQLKLVRLKKRGNTRGVTLVPYAAVTSMLANENAGALQEERDPGTRIVSEKSGTNQKGDLA